MDWEEMNMALFSVQMKMTLYHSVFFGVDFGNRIWTMCLNLRVCWISQDRKVVFGSHFEEWVMIWIIYEQDKMNDVRISICQEDVFEFRLTWLITENWRNNTADGWWLSTNFNLMFPLVLNKSNFLSGKTNEAQTPGGRKTQERVARRSRPSFPVQWQ